MLDLRALVVSTAPLAATTALVASCVRKAYPQIDGPRRVLWLVTGIAAFLVVVSHTAPWTVAGGLEAFVATCFVTAQTFGGVNLMDRVASKAGASAVAAVAVTQPAPSVAPPPPHA